MHLLLSLFLASLVQTGWADSASGYGRDSYDRAPPRGTYKAPSHHPYGKAPGATPFGNSHRASPAHANQAEEKGEHQRLGNLRGDITRDREFDYIVVGGGTAGNAIGARLAEAGHRVAIVEAGSLYEEKDGGIHTIPGQDIIGIGSLLNDTVKSDVDWKFHTEPQPGCNGRRIHYARGRCLGGSSALNFMIYHRASRGTYDLWADAVGDDAYRIGHFMKYFKRSMTFTPPDHQKRKANASTNYGIDDFYGEGRGGPVHVSFPHWVSSWSTWLEQGLKAVGMRKTSGYNEGGLLGYHYTTATIRPTDATRSSSAEYVYRMAKFRSPRLKVFLRTHALKVLFDKQKRAVGVAVKQGDATYVLKARKEVIVSAGAFQSPQLLMVSGIGPVETLRQYDIPVVSALTGVGQNMWDHVFFGPAYPVNFPTLNELVNSAETREHAEEEYRQHHSGPLTSNIIEFLGWEKLPARYRTRFSPQTQQKLAEFPADWPEVEYLGADGYIGDFTSPSKHQPRDGRNYASILGALVAPMSRGNITIRSNSALDDPIINPNWLGDRADQEVAVAWYRRMRDVWKSRPLQSIVTGPEAYPGEEIQSDEEVLNIVRDSIMTVWHPACTCKMGKKGDRTAVVDHQARVFGVQGLRVVDASSFPFLVPGHPQSAIYALAEKIAEDIVEAELRRAEGGGERVEHRGREQEEYRGREQEGYREGRGSQRGREAGGYRQEEQGGYGNEQQGGYREEPHQGGSGHEYGSGEWYYE
ncbi:hypothetical protein CDD83_8829 [Cordyceps sp. RAO-2017]|nr:hypothetical protein CDD83_8829 [Cordyceps sp. RAO-2017]